MKFHRKSMFWDKRGEDFEAEVFFVSKAVGAALDDADFIVHSFDETKADFVIHAAIRSDAIPMAFDHVGELFKWAQSLPSQLSLPVVEKLSCPAGLLVGPEVGKRFFEQIGFEELGVGIEESLERFAAFTAEMIPVGEQGVALAFDEAPILLTQAEILLSANLIDGVVKVADDMELIVNDLDMGTKADDFGKRLPHIHHRKSDFLSFVRTQAAKEKFKILFLASTPPKPNGTLSLQIADNDPILMAFTNGNLIDADGSGSGHPGSIHQFLKILLLQILDRLPVKSQQGSHPRNGLFPAHPAHFHGETTGKVRIGSQPLQPLGLHLATARTIHPSNVQFQVNPSASTIQIPDLPRPFVVKTPQAASTTTANRFFARRINRMTRACGSPHIPFSRSNARNPGNRYKSDKVCPFFMQP